MVSFVALFRGPTIQGASLVAVTSDPTLVTHVAGALLQKRVAGPTDDPALRAVEIGRRRALKLMRQEGSASARSGGPPRRLRGNRSVE